MRDITGARMMKKCSLKRTPKTYSQGYKKTGSRPVLFV